MTIKQVLLAGTTAFGVLAGLTSPAAAEKWDMPLAYPATNFHSENAAQFARCVTEKRAASWKS